MMRTPCATYRVQFNKNFRFQDAQALLPYLRAIGISDLYASPIFQARSGTLHGYDITNPSKLNAETGTAQDFQALSDELREHGMGLMLDIVPNHMAASTENPWWMDVLESGEASAYAAFFDVEWGDQAPRVPQKIHLPVLGEPYGTALEEQKLRLSIQPGGFRIHYHSLELPVDPGTYRQILCHRYAGLGNHLDESNPALAAMRSAIQAAETLPARTTAEWIAFEARQREIPELKQKLWAAYSGHAEIREFLDENIRLFNGEPGNGASFDMLDVLLNSQPYQLTYWRVAREKINYRRFFDVNDLIGIRAQDPQVFDATHQLAFCLLARGQATALRVDHIDGLFDPAAYLARLQERAASVTGGQAYVTVEKILAEHEDLPAGWPVAGTTGYDFLGFVNNLFVDPAGLEALDAVYTRYTGAHNSFAETAYSQKKRIAGELFEVEIGSLAVRLNDLAEQDRHARDLSPAGLRRALIEVTSCLGAYRTYTQDFHVAPADRAAVEQALSEARSRAPEIEPRCFDFLERVLLPSPPGNAAALRFVMRWQQLTGPVMAKGVEDTTLYRYNRLISMNEVGGFPRACPPEEFHAFNQRRRERWPLTMNATSTHDTKRSEDVRARLNLLSEMPDVWERSVKRWTRWNRAKKRMVDGQPAPDANDEYLLYQTMVGAWPLEKIEEPQFRDRLKQYATKALREAKRRTSWLEPNPAYEDGVLGFVDAILDERDNPFLDHFRRFQQRIAFYGAVNSLSQTLLKIGCPGIPDFYQGTTLWDFSLVDPDNRRPPEVPSRVELVAQMPCWSARELVDCWQDGRIKPFLIYKALELRRARVALFEQGEYLPLECRGVAETHVLAFARRFKTQWAVIAVPRFLTKLSSLERMPPRRAWNGSVILLPDGAPQTWTHAFTGETLQGGAIAAVGALGNFPVALLYAS